METKDKIDMHMARIKALSKTVDKSVLEQIEKKLYQITKTYGKKSRTN